MAEHELAIPIEPSEWFTPPGIFETLGLVFDLDPCSPGPGHWVPAKRIYVKADDGLRQPWHGLVFMNPPFGGRRGHVPWLKKFFAHGNGIALCTARTSSDWFHDVVVPNAELLCFPRGKTKFIRPSGEISKEPGSGVALIAVGSIACAALLRSGLGACYAPVPSLAPMTNDEKATRQADSDERTLDPRILSNSVI
jgi:DNA N-6-adenine-methyltransferase (Dam)